MNKIFDAGEKLFFNILIICLVSWIYFNILPMNKATLITGFVLCVLYFGMYFYIGYKYNFTLVEAFIVGIIGCGIGIFLYFFSLYTDLVLQNVNSAIWIIKPYFIPTMSMIKLFTIEVTIAYPFFLMIFNIFLVILGSISKKIMNKLSS